MRTASKVIAGHPRLWITPEGLKDFRRDANGFRHAWRAKVIRKLDALVASAQRSKFTRDKQPQWVALGLGQAWQLTKDDKYVRAAERLLESLEPFVAGQGYDAWGSVAYAAAVCYDWMYDCWRRRGQLKEIASFVALTGRRALDDLLHRYILDDWHNYGLRLQQGALAAAIALGDEHPELEDGGLLQTVYRMHFTGLPYAGVRIQDAFCTPPTVCCLDAALRCRGRDGAGAGFSCLWEASGAYHTIDALAIICMAELWTKALARCEKNPIWPELTEAGFAMLQLRRPDGRNTAWGDAGAYPIHKNWRVADALCLLHARTPTPIFAEYLRGFAVEQHPLPMFPLLYAAPDAMPRGQGTTRLMNALPTAVRVGPLAILRSGWKAADTFVTLRCGQFGGWHNHLDHGAFTLHRGGILAADPPPTSYEGDYRPQYAMRSIAHNTVLVRNARERAWPGRYNLPCVNDGGQRIVSLSHQPPNANTGGPHPVLTAERRGRLADEFDMGRFLALQSGPRIDYVAADATRAYTYPWSGLGTNPARRVEEFVRQIVFLKPDWIVVFDRVEATRAEYRKTWLLHTMKSPAFFCGGKKQCAPKGVQRIPADGPFEFAHQRGRLTVWPLLPAQRVVRAVGGPGFQAWIEGAPGSDGSGGRNFPAPLKSSESPQWRLEISPRAPRARDCFLTVLHAGLQGAAPVRKRYAFEVNETAGAVELVMLDRGEELARVGFQRLGTVVAEVLFAGEQLRHSAKEPERVRQA